MRVTPAPTRARPARRTALQTLLAATILAATTMAAPSSAASTDSAAPARAWPDRPIKVIVPYTPGGATDTVTRIVMDKLAARLGQNIVIENKPGANSTLGAAIAAKAEPDGYTFLSILPAYVINTHLYKLSYSPSELEPVVHMADLPLFLFVSKDVPANSLQELVAHGRKHPDTLTYASSGTGSSAHLTGADFALQSGLKMTHVAYKGSAPILADLLAGRVSMVFDPVLVPMQYVRQDKLKVLAFTGKQRWPDATDVPTMEEGGFPGFVTGSWVGLLAPTGTPRPVIERMAKEISAIVQEPDVTQKFIAAGFLPTGSTPAEFTELMRKDSDRYAKIIEEAGITVN